MAVEQERLFGQPQPCVVIAGNGVAASALGCLLLDRGFGVVYLTRHAAPRQPAVIEAFPEATVRLFDEVGLADALHRAGAVAVRGFHHADPSDSFRMDGWWTHVERGRLARACFREARRRGAASLPVARLEPRIEGGAGDAQICVDGSSLVAFAAVDATGRAARWARPVHLDQPAVTALYGGPGADQPTPGRFVATADGWAYCLCHPDGTTVGVTARTSAGRLLDADVASVLGVVDASPLIPLGQRPASVQWSERPIGDGWLAVGDAALAYSPLAGQGVRFALSSALAAAAVLATWRDGETALAIEYYRSWVDEARRRHLTRVGRVRASDGFAPDRPSGKALDRGVRLRFVADVRRVPVNTGGRIHEDDALVLPDGGLVRWVGGFDLVRLRHAVELGRTVGGTCAELECLGVSATTARLLIAWSLEKGLLAEHDVAAADRQFGPVRASRAAASPSAEERRHRARRGPAG